MTHRPPARRAPARAAAPLTLALAALLAPLAAAAQSGPPEGRGPLGFQVRGGAVHQFDSGLDGGGEVSVNRWFVEPGAQYDLGGAASVGLSLGYGESAYDFGPGTAFGGGDPWGTARDLRLSLPVRIKAGERLTAILIPSVRWNAETGGDFDDGRTEGAIAAGLWRFSPTFALGAGVGVFSALADDMSVFPFLTVDWDVTDRINIGTGGGLAATQGPGLTVTWKATETVSLGLGGRYESIEFALDDTGVAPGGIAQEDTFPLFATLDWTPLPFAAVGLVAGLELGGELTLRDAQGRRLDSAEVDPAPFVGFTARLRF